MSDRTPRKAAPAAQGDSLVRIAQLERAFLTLLEAHRALRSRVESIERAGAVGAVLLEQAQRGADAAEEIKEALPRISASAEGIAQRVAAAEQRLERLAAVVEASRPADAGAVDLTGAKLVACRQLTIADENERARLVLRPGGALLADEHGTNRAQITLDDAGLPVVATLDAAGRVIHTAGIDEAGRAYTRDPVEPPAPPDPTDVVN